MTINTTLNEIKAFDPCKSGWKTLLTSLNKIEADSEPLSMLHILESNGVQDIIWCMQVNWFEHKTLYMQFVNNCVVRAKDVAGAAYAYADAAYADADAAYAYAYAAYAAYSAAYAAYAAYGAAYAAYAAYDAELNLQYEDLKRLLLEHDNGTT